MKLSSKLNKNLLDKISKAEMSNTLDMTGEELLLCVAFVVGSHISRKTRYVNELIRRYGKPSKNSELGTYLSDKFDKDVAEKNSSAVSLFWEMLHEMGSTLRTELVSEALNEEFQTLRSELKVVNG